MLSRAVVCFFAFLSLFATCQIYAAPTREVTSRQLGTAGCELARLGVSTGLSILQGILTTVEGQVTDNAALSTVIQIVLDAVSAAESAVSSFDSISTPADALALVEANIAAVESALGVLANSTSSDIGANIEKALDQIGAMALADALAACQ